MDSDQIRSELERLHAPAFGWAMVCCRRDRDLAIETLQQTYCRILSRKTTFRGQSEFSTWLFGVIKMIALEQSRVRQSRPLACKRTEPLVDTSSRGSIQATMEQEELADELNAALEKLSNRQREVLHLTFYQELTIEQAAKCMGISVGSARQHYQRGKIRLKKMLAHSWELHNE